MNIVVLAAVGLLVLVGLVAVGLGHRRWNWATVAAAFLVLMSTTAYLYLAARIAARDRGWTRAVSRYEIDLARVRDGLAPGPRGGLAPIEGQPSLATLAADRDRLRRALARVETWRSPAWENASFTPPKDAASTGQIDLPAEGEAEDAPPLQAGAHVFVFDMAKLADGGRYLGEFIVRAVTFDAGTKRFVLKVGHASPPDKADIEALAGRHDAVAVFENLPVDRWLAFYRTRQQAEQGGGSVMPEPVKAVKEAEAALQADGEVPQLVADFIESVKTHDEAVPEDEWAAVTEGVTAGRTLPGTLWAVVEFIKPHVFERPASVDEEQDIAKREYDEGERVELDLVTALDLQKAGTGKITTILRRRPLSDALARLHGAPILAGAAGEQGIRADGVAGLTERLMAEVADLRRAEERLTRSLESVNAGRAQATAVAGQLQEDLASWKRDATEATRLAAAFQEQLDTAARGRTEAERQVVDLGRELTAIVARLTAEVDRVAPPPVRR